MSTFIEIKCGCGRMVRASRDQAGSSVRCWNCGSDVSVPTSRTGARVFGEFAGSLIDTFGAGSISILMAGGLAETLLLLVPYVGTWLALAGLVVGARFYQDLIRDTAPRVSGAGAEGRPVEGPSELVRWGLAVLAVLALVAPFVVRSNSRGLILIARWVLLAVAVAFWVVVPLILYAVNARDRRGRLPTRPAMDALARFPAATLAALLIFPLGLCLLEFVTATVAHTEDYTLMLADDLFPHPQMAFIGDRTHLIYRYDDLRHQVPLGFEDKSSLRIYSMAVRRGYTFVGTIPASLKSWLETGSSNYIWGTPDPSYMALRTALTLLILTGAATLLSIQARWLGLIALVGTRRDDAVAPNLFTHPLPHPIPEPIPVGPAVAVRVADRPVELAPGPGPAVPATPAGSVQRTVLIVDADRGFTVGLGRVLSGRGFGVVLAGSASEALAVARGAHPDLVVLDTALPDRSGIELCENLRAEFDGRLRPILIATSQIATSQEISSMARVADDYLIKPYVIEALVMRINQHLQNRP